MNLFNVIEYDDLTEKVANKQMSSFGPDWAKDILEYFFDSYPELINSDSRLVFKAKDPEKGYAVGAIHVNDLFVVPFIIDNFSLYPLDVAITMDGRYLPFNRETLNTFISNPSAFQSLKSLAPDEVMSGLFDRHMSYGTSAGNGGSQGTYKAGEFLQKISHFIPVAIIKERLLKQIQDDHQIKMAFAQNEEAKEILAHLASIPNAPTKESLIKEAKSKTDRDIYLLTKTGEYAWNLRVGSSNVDEYTDVAVNEEDIDEMPLYKGAAFQPNKPNRPTPEHVLLTLQNTTDKLYIDKKGNYSIKNNCQCDAKPDKLASFDLTHWPSSGDTGIFTINGEALTNPFMITKTASEQGHLHIEATDGITRQEFTVVRPNNNRMWADNDNSDHWMVPGNAEFLKLGTVINNAELTPELTLAHLVHRVNESQYQAKGKILEKYADKHGFSSKLMNKDEMMWAALHCGANINDVAKIAEMNEGERYKFEVDLKLPREISSLIDETVIGDIPESGVTKIAAHSSDTSTVDAMLSLNFLNKNTLRQYIEVLPNYEQVMSQLARLLITIRLGYKQVPERPVKDAMSALASVIVVLKGLKMGAKK